jgi:4-hydroxyphenylpyruvate dioxygenase
MITSIATVSLSGNLRQKLEAAAAAGFEGVEIFETDLLGYDGDAREVGRFIAELGLTLVAFQPFRDFEGMPEPQRGRAFERAESKFDLMGELGAELLLVCSNVSPMSQGGLDRAAEDLAALGERAAGRGLRVGFEALAWGRHISDYRDAWEAVRRADHAAVGLVLDSFHILARGHDLSAMSSIPKERIFLCQLADAPMLDMGVLSWSRHHRCFPGQGRLPLGAFMSALADTRYDGPLSLEIFNDHFRAAPPDRIAADGRRSLILLADETGHGPLRAALGEASQAPGVRVEGLEFIEFAVGEDEAAALRDLLARLGFEQAGRHVSKNVDLWRQGDINLVVNCEPDGFAHSHNIVHGPSVCALGLRVTDAEAALARARLHLAAPFRQPVGPGELEIPAVRGLEGSLFYLVGRYGGRGTIWEVDFDLHEAEAERSAGLVHVDHMVQVAHFGWLSSWVLFYRGLFGFGATPESEIVDPRGLIQSQVVESLDRRIRIALNVSQAQGTAAGRFLSEFFGGGVQQIAFASDDIVATAKRLEANGVPLLPIPGNYYDDLESRFDVDPGLLATLRRHNILYDRGEGGEFFQLFTDTFADRFYFEIVERRGYQQYGAANAPIRLAAQARLAEGRHPYGAE